MANKTCMTPAQNGIQDLFIDIDLQPKNDSKINDKETHHIQIDTRDTEFLSKLPTELQAVKINLFLEISTKSTKYDNTPISTDILYPMWLLNSGHKQQQPQLYWLCFHLFFHL